MKSYQNLTTEIRNNILFLTINRPKKLNALDIRTMTELSDVGKEINISKEFKGVIITGSGKKAFVAGADISEIANLNEKTSLEYSKKGQAIFSLFENSSKPIMAAINGFALGGGCELAMACHIRIASTNAKFGQPEVNIGIIPGFGGTQRMTQLIGKSNTFEYCMTGKMLDAHQAKSLGLVNQVVNLEYLLETAEKTMLDIISKPPLALQKLINSINGYYQFTDGFANEAKEFSKCTTTKDFVEGTSAFLEKRTPKFTGK